MMWMMGYNDAGEFNTIQDPFTGRKLRPLMPRAAVASSTARDHFHGLNHHLAMVEQDKRDIAATTQQQVVVSSRWNPTPEQLQTLEELYKRGTRTPTADQIQQITSQLRRYGKIEGKNVFYWFQNHKARERQKRRRHLESFPDDGRPNNQTDKRLEKSEPQGTAFEVEEAKNWVSPTNNSVKTTQGATKGADQAECKSDGCVHFDIDDAAAQILSHNQRRRRRNATWQMHKRPHDNFINIFDLEPYFNPQHLHHHQEGAQTLQLFPVETIHDERAQEDEEGATISSSSSASDPVTTPYQFFEFLPLKN